MISYVVGYLVSLLPNQQLLSALFVNFIMTFHTNIIKGKFSLFVTTSSSISIIKFCTYVERHGESILQKKVTITEAYNFCFHNRRVSRKVK